MPVPPEHEPLGLGGNSQSLRLSFPFILAEPMFAMKERARKCRSMAGQAGGRNLAKKRKSTGCLGESSTLFNWNWVRSRFGKGRLNHEEHRVHEGRKEVRPRRCCGCPSRTGSASRTRNVEFIRLPSSSGRKARALLTKPRSGCACAPTRCIEMLWESNPTLSRFQSGLAPGAAFTASNQPMGRTSWLLAERCWLKSNSHPLRH